MDKIAVFDFDKTCIKFDSEEAIFEFMMKKESVSDKTKSLIHYRFENYKTSSIERCIYATKTFAWFAKQQIRSWTKEMLVDHPDYLQINPPTKSLYNECIRQWCKVYIISASIEDIVEIVAEYFGYKVEKVIWSVLDVDDNDLYTDNIIQLPCFEGKVSMIKKYIWTIPDICVGDSPNDTPMLLYSKQWYIVPTDDSMITLAWQHDRIVLEKEPVLENSI